MTRYRALLLCALLGATQGLLGCHGGGSPEVRKLTLGEEAPEFALATLDGSRIESHDLSGKVVVLNFWATWCQPCRRETPELVALARDPRLEVVGIALDEAGAAAVKPFVEAQGVPYKVLLGNPDVFARFAGFTIPYTVVLDRSRRVVNVYRRPVSRHDVEADLARIEALEATT